MLNGPESAARRRAGLTLLGLILSLLTWSGLRADTVVKLAWDPNQESDLAGYRLYYGTSSGRYGQPIDVGNVTSYDLHGLSSGTTYFFAVAAYDLAGNLSGYSNEVAATPTTVIGASPTIASAVETATHSIYILQAGRHTIGVTGANFQVGATIALGPDITAGATSLSGTTQLSATIDVGATATLGPRTLTVSNPDGGSGSLAPALDLARTPDINRDCKVDSIDVNVIAREFGKRSGDTGYDSAADLDGSGVIDGADLLIFTDYFGIALAVCP